VVDADSSSRPDLLDARRLGPLVPPPSRRRPPSNAIQPPAEPQEPRAALPRPGNGGNVWKSGGGGRDGEDLGDGERVASDEEDKDTGYSSGPDDEDDDDDN